MCKGIESGFGTQGVKADTLTWNLHLFSQPTPHPTPAYHPGTMAINCHGCRYVGYFAEKSFCVNIVAYSITTAANALAMAHWRQVRIFFRESFISRMRKIITEF